MIRLPGHTLLRGFLRTHAFGLSRLLVLIVAALILLGLLSSSANQGAPREGTLTAARDQARTLAPGEIIKQNVKGGETHAYLLRLAPKQYARVVVEQQGVDLVLNLLTADRQLVVQSDKPNGKRGPEAVSALAEFAGDYIVEVSASKAQPAGSYELRFEGPRESGTADEKRVEAERLFMEGQKLMSREPTLPRAIESLEKALAVWREIDDAREEGYTLCSLGETYRRLKDLPKSIDYLNRAIARLQVVLDIPGQAYALNEMGAAQRDLGTPLQALEYYARALELRRSIGDRWGQAQIQNNIGYAYTKMGRQQKAIENLEAALPLWRAVGDRAMEMNTLNNIAKAQSELGNLSSAFEQFNEVLRFCDETGDERLKPYVENNLGMIYDTWAESQEALKRYNKALELFGAAGKREGEATVLNNTGMVYAELGDTQSALDYLQQSYVLRQQLKLPGDAAITLSNIGYVQTLMGNYQEAIKTLADALSLSESSSDKRFEAYSSVRLGMVYMALGNPKRALEFYRKALAIQTDADTEDRRGQAITLDKIGQAHARMGEPSEALGSYRQALGQWTVVGDKQGQALTLYGIARVEMGRNRLAEARDRVEEAISLVESLRYKMSSHQLRMKYFADRHDLYALSVDIRMRLYDLNRSDADLEAALFDNERARARDLLDIIVEAHADLNKGMSGQDAERSRRLEREISTLTQSWLSLRSIGQMEDANAVEEKLNARINEQEKLKAELRTADPSYASLNRPRALSLNEVQQLLDEDTILLEYALHDERSFLWAVTRNKIVPYSLPGRAEIENAALKFRRSMTAYEQPRPGEGGSEYLNRLKTAAAQHRQLALSLSRKVLGQVSPQLGQKRLLIVADGALQYVPFEALPFPAGVGQGASEYQPLILQREIVYEPSATTLGLLRTIARPQPTKTLAVFADPVFDSSDDRVHAQGRGKKSAAAPVRPATALSSALRDVGDVGTEGTAFTLNRLKYTEKEANAITASAQSGSWMKALGFSASRAAVTSEALSQYRIIHFATHGILNDRHPELSGIVLSMVDELGQPTDGYLRLGDIYTLNLPVQLVVLSACRTGIGKQIRGEGLISLTRGFMYAGAARVVASLWKVDDRATSELMRRFYWHMLKEQKPAAAALRLAQIEVMQASEDWGAPYYWAGFVLHGDWK